VTGAPRRSGLQGERGLTLAEVLVALAVIGGALVGLAIVIPVAVHGVQAGQQLSAATFLAEQAIERARSAVWSEHPAIDCLGVSSGDSAPAPTGATCRGATSTQFPDETGGVGGHPSYRRSVRVSSCASDPCAGLTTAEMRRVEVTVAYTPLTSAGVSPTPTTVRLEWLVTRR
jgi:prepilin-type N-terminal cleavage/methylation domain-containing protein